MADRVFCIDFGSAFTKVALRRDPGADAELLRYGFTTAGEVDFCVPSVVGVVRQGSKNVPIFGDAAMGSRHGNGVHLHTNWKKLVFAPEEAAAGPQKPPLDALLDSAELLDLATKFGVTPGQLIHLRNVVSNARALVGGPSPAAEPVAKARALAAAIASHFFGWLREQVLNACARLPLDGLDPASIPTRITVPAFNQGADLEKHPGCQLLLSAMSRAGWRLHPDRPVVAEPYSNAIGVLTGGSNATLKSRRINMGQMFGRGPLITALREPKNHDSYRALVIDVGAFTTDFAAVEVRPKGETIDDPDAAFVVRQHSVPLGVTDLDARLFAALPPEKRDWLTKTALPVELEGFRSAVYTNGKPYKSVEVGAIGGAVDADAVRGAVDNFLKRVSVEAEAFCSALEPVNLQELVLTGGGVGIPRVRESLIGAAQADGRSFVKTHAPGLKRGAADGVLNALADETARGGSALGGASLYYEKDYY